MAKHPIVMLAVAMLAGTAFAQAVKLHWDSKNVRLSATEAPHGVDSGGA